MTSPPLDPPVADTAPEAAIITKYDQRHFITYLRLLDAEAAGAPWQDVARIVLHIDPDRDEARAHMAWQTHLARARWLTSNGYRQLWRGASPE
jgi:hypothetical protein